MSKGGRALQALLWVCLFTSIIAVTVTAPPSARPSPRPTSIPSPIPTPKVTPSLKAAEKAAVKGFYDSFGSDWSYGGNNPNVCGWTGIGCDNGRVQSISISGDFPPEKTIPSSIGQLSVLNKLSSLELYSIGLIGAIPTEISLLSSLSHLDLSSNRLSGEPTAIWALKPLTYLDLSDNNLEGSLPSAIGNFRNLKVLSLYRNSFEGTVPESLYGCRSLTYFDISKNSIHGNISSGIGLLDMLDTLILNNNQLRGTIPSQLGFNKGLTSLSLQNNLLTGPIPSDLASMSKLQEIDLSNNFFSGQFFDTAVKMTSLRLLSVNTNQISGTLPSFISNLASLQGFDASSNTIFGSLPTEIGLLDSLVTFKANLNQLEGTIPTEIGRLVSLTSFDVSENWLGGTVPSAIVNLANLVEFGIAKGNFSGSIPSALSRLTKLKVLSIGENHFSKSLPSFLGSLTSMINLGLNDNSLTGTLPAELLNLRNLTMLYMHHNTFRGPLPTFQGFDKLNSLYLHNNKFSSTLPLSWADLTSLHNLWFNNNNISGEINLGMMSRLTALETFMAYDNDLMGTLPTSLGRLTNLSAIDIHGNQFISPLPDLGALQQLEYLSVASNKLNNSLPLWMFTLTQLKYFNASGNELSKSIPSTISQSNVLYLDLSRNSLTGTLPLLPTSLKILMLDGNKFSKQPFPVQLTEAEYNFSNLQVLSLRSNSLKGVLPDISSSLPNLKRLLLSNNSLGIQQVIPSTLGSLSSLLELDLSYNEFHGSAWAFPTTLCNLNNLFSLVLTSNKIGGAIPSCLISMTALSDLFLGDNQITSTIPSDLSQLTNLARFFLQNNRLEGPIPSTLGSLRNIAYFSVNNNAMSSTIPSSLSLVSSLKYLDLGNNFFSSPRRVSYNQQSFVDGLDLFTPARTPLLSYIDVSLNNFVGSVPASFFTLPLLETAVLTGNCFQGELPNTICNASNVRNLILNGLSVGDPMYPTTCSGRLWNGSWSWVAKVFNFDAVISQRMDGSIPSCIFLLPKLTKFHIGGNGFLGKIDPQLSSWPLNLSELVLSHNRLSQSIPSQLQLSFSRLDIVDLSFNKFNGTIDSLQLPKKQLDLTVNRLSGSIPTSASQAPGFGDYNILLGNAFACKSDRSDLPPFDSAREYTKCGSDIPNDLIFIFISFLAAYAAFYWQVHKEHIKMNKAKGVSQGAEKEGETHIKTFLRKAEDLLTLIKILTVIFSVVLLPVYGTATLYYHSRTFSYLWTLSGAFKTGQPASILLLVFFSGVAVVTFALLLIFMSIEKKLHSPAAILNSLCQPPAQAPSSPAFVLPPQKPMKEINFPAVYGILVTRLVLVFSITFVIAFAANISYVDAIPTLKSSEILFAQVAVALFKSALSKCASSFLGHKISYLGYPVDDIETAIAEVPHLEELKDSFLIFLFLELVIRILVPCGASAYADRNCFQAYFKGGQPIFSQFNATIDMTKAQDVSVLTVIPQIKDHDVQSNSITVSQQTAIYASRIQVESDIRFLPPYEYKYQCGSRIVEVYAPVIATSVVIALLWSFWGHICRFCLTNVFSTSKNETDPASWRGWTHRLLLSTLQSRLDWTRTECDMCKSHVLAELCERKVDEKSSSSVWSSRVWRYLPYSFKRFGKWLLLGKHDYPTQEQVSAFEVGIDEKDKERLDKEGQRRFNYQHHNTILAFDFALFNTFGVVCVPFGLMILANLAIKNQDDRRRVRKLFEEVSREIDEESPSADFAEKELKLLEEACNRKAESEGSEVFRARWLLLAVSVTFTSFLVYDAVGDQMGGRVAKNYPLIQVFLSLGLALAVELAIRQVYQAKDECDGSLPSVYRDSQQGFELHQGERINPMRQSHDGGNGDVPQRFDALVQRSEDRRASLFQFAAPSALPEHLVHPPLRPSFVAQQRHSSGRVSFGDSSLGLPVEFVAGRRPSNRNSLELKFPQLPAPPTFPVSRRFSER